MSDVYSFISSYIPQCLVQNEYKNEFLKFISNNNQCGHITVSGMICSADYENLLLCFHNRYREWAPIGGHKSEEETIFEALRREISEEIGILDKDFTIDFNCSILSLDKKKYQCRTKNTMHYDISLLVRLSHSSLLFEKNQEIQELRFFNLKKKEFLSVSLPAYTKRYCFALEKYLLTL